MSDIIQLLPDSVANQIAAGEVIQRPASVIKELVENAIDASATHIDISVTDAGKTQIQVVDNGIGMSSTDARLSFERHATSKIRKADDLFALQTMGFRGEALASIAAVAQITLRTRREADPIGTELHISGSRYESQEPCALTVGSHFTINNLFYNIPARRKFLKSNTTELNNIITTFQRIALVYPEIEFTLQSNGAELYRLHKSTLKQRIQDIFGKKLAQDLHTLNIETTLCKITGFIGSPKSAKKKSAQQYFFANGRYMKHPYFSKAITNAFERLVPAGEAIPYFIYFEVNPQDIDVNIHPTKTEIKFENEQAIWQILFATIKDTIGLFSGSQEIDFNINDNIEIPTFNPSLTTTQPQLKINTDYNPFLSTSDDKREKKNNQNWKQLYHNLKPNIEENTIFPDQKGLTAYTTPQTTSPLIQHHASYIITSLTNGLMIIDQHRAHLRILFDQYLQQLQQHNGIGQKELFPDILQLTPAEDNTLKQILEDITSLGFELTPLGAYSYAINAIPSTMDGANPIQTLNDIIHNTIEQDSPSTDQIHQTIALSLASASAIPRGQTLSTEEMQNLITSLFTCSNRQYTPTGKPIFKLLEDKELEG